MAVNLEHFCRLRPFLYHLTASENVERIKRTRCLEPAVCLAKKANKVEVLKSKRKEAIAVRIGQDRIIIRDQAPLHEGNITFQEGWTFNDLLKELNSRIFFWPGRNTTGMIEYGRRHFLRYSSEKPRIIRVETRNLIDTNPEASPQFCKFNSGSPRCSGGRGSPRGPHTFVEGNAAPFDGGNAVEVTFSKRIVLPKNTQVALNPNGPWQNFFDA